MLVVDTSALLAVIQREPEQEAFSRLIASAAPCLISAVTLLEAGMVIARRRGLAHARDLDELIAAFRIEVVPFDAEQAALGRAAVVRFGKGRHAAALNFGDCAAYALAKATGYPLLFKGQDFARTDIARAVAVPGL